jgi:hypothetical protein
MRFSLPPSLPPSPCIAIHFVHTPGGRASLSTRCHMLGPELFVLQDAVCVFITAGPSTKLFAWGGGGVLEDMCYERRRAEACVD